MKSIFFPFSKKHTLADHVWHRFAIVLYWILIVGSLYGIFAMFQYPQARSLSACYNSYIKSSPSIPLDVLTANCKALEPDGWGNLLIAVIGTLVVSYLIQAIYYKVILFVAFGSRRE